MEAVADNQESSQVAYVFPGQGSQSVGMGLDLYRSSKAAKEIFDEARKAKNPSWFYALRDIRNLPNE